VSSFNNIIAKSYPILVRDCSITPTMLPPIWTTAVYSLSRRWGVAMRVAIVAICLSIVGLAGAEGVKASVRKPTNIPPEGLGPALTTLAKEFDFQVLYRTEVVGTLKTQGVSGAMTATEALEHVLSGTGLIYKYLDEKTVTIALEGTRSAGPQAQAASENPSSDDFSANEEKKSSSWGFRIAQADQGKAAGDVSTAEAIRTPDKHDALEEIVVTAEKRASTIQDTPISMSALSGDVMQQQGIMNLTDVILAVPGISVRTAGPGQTELEMRGLASSGGSSPTVGFYLDDYSLTPPAASLVGKIVIDPDLFDLNRVEVLRGPQGTLYGSGSMGGTVKLVTNEPKLNDFEGAVEVIGSGMSGGGFNRGGNMMLNVPLINDRVAMRVVLTDKYTDGWITRYVLGENFPPPTGPGPCGPGWPGCTRGDVAAVAPTTTVPRINWERLQGGRIELLAQPADALKIDATVMYQKITMGGYNEYDIPPGNPDARYQPFNLAEPISDEFKVFGVTATYDMSFAQLTSASAYYSREENQTQDVSETLYSVTGLFGVKPTAFYPIPYNNIDTTHQFSEEIRMASTGTGALQWIGGVFFTKFESIYAQYNASAPLAYLSVGGAAANPDGIIYQAHNPYHIEQYAVFGQGTYALTDTLKATVGLRWYRFNSRIDEETSGFGAPSGNAAPLYNSFASSNSGVNPKATLSYEQNHDLTVYGTVARGFRPGGFNQQIPSSICTATQETYGPDSIWNYEVGEKAKMLNGKVVVNADIYYIRWRQVQQLASQSCGYGLTLNAGAAESYGPEIEVMAVLTPDLTLTFSGAYTHATLASVTASAARADPVFVPGFPILNIPKWTETTSLTYMTPISDNYKFMARVNNSYVGQSTDVEFNYATLPSYDLVNLRFGLVGKKLSGYIFTDNLTNKRAELGINTTGFSWTSPSIVRAATNQPRTVGVDIQYNF
jgi:iron complex outermembrane recepter protein